MRFVCSHCPRCLYAQCCECGRKRSRRKVAEGRAHGYLAALASFGLVGALAAGAPPRGIASPRLIPATAAAATLPVGFAHQIAAVGLVALRRAFGVEAHVPRQGSTAAAQAEPRAALLVPLVRPL